MNTITNTAKRNYTRTNLLVLAVAIVLLAVSALQAGYRLILPTDGWDYSDGETVNDFATGVVIFTENLVGTSSPLRAGDRLLAVEGLSVPPSGSSLTTPRSIIADAWHVGQTVRYTLLREGKQIDVAVPLVQWTPASVARYSVASAQGLSNWLGTLVMLVTGLLVFVRRPNELAARALLLVGTTILAQRIGGIVPDGVSTQYSAVWPLSNFYTYWIYAIALAPSLLLLALGFPRPKQFIQRFPALALLPYAGFWLLTLLFGLRAEVGYGLTCAYLLLAIISVSHASVTLRDSISRAQLRWGFGGFIISIVLFLPVFLAAFGLIDGALASAGNAVSNFVSPVLGICLAVAILRYRLFDIDIIIRRTLIYSVLTLALGATYVLCVVVLQALFVRLTGQESTLAVVASTLAIAALFVLLRRRVQALIDRRFYRKKYDARQVLAAFAQRIQTEAELETIAADMIGVVQETLEPEHVQLWIVRR